MNKLILALAAAAALPLSVQAQEATPAPEWNQPSKLTRAEVLAELRRSQASGEYARIMAEGQEGVHPGANASWEARRLARAQEKAQRDSKTQ